MPQQNGETERKNRRLLEVARALLLGNNVPSVFWEDVILSHTYLFNQMPSKILQLQTPFPMFLEFYPHDSHLNSFPKQDFGYAAFVFMVMVENWT